MCHPRLYVWSLNVAGSAVILVSVLRVIWVPVEATWLMLAVLALVSGATVLRLRSVFASFSVGDVFSFAALFLYGPEAGTLTVALDTLAISTRLKGSAARVIFNTAAPSLAMWCAGTAVFSVAESQRLVDLQGIARITLTAVASIAIVFFVGTAFVAGAIATHEKVRVTRVWRQHFAQLWVTPFACGYVGALLAMLTRHAGVYALTAIIPIPLLLYYTFRTSLGRMDDNVQHLGDMNRMYRSTIEAFATAVDAKDNVTHGHIRRVQTYCSELARELGADDEATLKSLDAAALLHDVGKIGIPEHILNKPGRLTPAEFEEMKRHVTIGANILSTVEFPFPVVPIVKSHHESWDGSGYPEGLRGEAIPLGARILGVVDCFDALTSDRPYRAALSAEAAFDILRERRGRMYDPHVVDTFIALQPRLAIAGNAGIPDAVGPSLPTSVTAGLPEAGPAPSDLADAIVKLLTDLLVDNLCVVYERDGSSSRIVARTAAGPDAAATVGHRIALGHGVSGWVAANRSEIIETAAVLDFPDRVGDTAFAMQTCTSVPLTAALPLVVTVYGPAKDGAARARVLRSLSTFACGLRSDAQAA